MLRMAVLCMAAKLWAVVRRAPEAGCNGTLGALNSATWSRGAASKTLLYSKVRPRAVMPTRYLHPMNKALILMSALIAAALPGWAALGGSVETVASDQVRMQAKRAITQMREYNIHLISRDDGTLIKEYVTPAGKVFGVSWTGPTIPDLTQLLGTYSAEFQTSVRAQPRRRKAGVVRNPDLVVESTGHMRAFYGRAYVNSMLPSGVTAETVK